MNANRERTGLWAGLGATAAAALASVYCVGPLVLAGLGLGGLGLAAGLVKYRLAFLAVTAVLLAVACYQTYRRREVVCAGGSCEVRAGSRTMKVVLWGITVGAVALAAYPNHAGILTRRVGPAAEPVSDRGRLEAGVRMPFARRLSGLQLGERCGIIAGSRLSF